MVVFDIPLPQKSDKSGSKFLYGGGWYQKRQKKSDIFYRRPHIVTHFLPSNILQHWNLRPPSPLKYSNVFYRWPLSIDFWPKILLFRTQTAFWTKSKYSLGCYSRSCKLDKQKIPRLLFTNKPTKKAGRTTFEK